MTSTTTAYGTCASLPPCRPSTDLGKKKDLLESPSSLVLNDPTFHHWWGDDKTRILWNSRRPGKRENNDGHSLHRGDYQAIGIGPSSLGDAGIIFLPSQIL